MEESRHPETSPSVLNSRIFYNVDVTGMWRAFYSKTQPPPGGSLQSTPCGETPESLSSLSVHGERVQEWPARLGVVSWGSPRWSIFPGLESKLHEIKVFAANAYPTRMFQRLVTGPSPFPQTLSGPLESSCHYFPAVSL